MTMQTSKLPEICDVVIVGGGPAGLATATHLKALGVASVIVIEREPQAGGVPRHCGHPPYGLREFKRLMTGPAYAVALVNEAQRAGVEIHTSTTVVKIHEGGRMTLSTDDGTIEIVAKRVVLCTGVRETPCAPQFVSSQRPLGISTTGALQAMVYLNGTIPFKKPIIIGSELVTFSSLLTCRKAGIKPVAIIETNSRITAHSILRFAPMFFGVPLQLNTSLVEIIGKTRVKGVRVKSLAGSVQKMDCDGVLFTGKFVPEASLVRMGHLEIDQASGGPVVDQNGQCSDPSYFAVGNILHAVETAGWCWKEGIQMAAIVFQSLAKGAPRKITLDVVLKSTKLKYITPQIISLPRHKTGFDHFQLRFREAAKGELSLRHNGKILWSRKGAFQPERRVLIPLTTSEGNIEPVEVHFSEER
jgi:NADPH-dependent 2,4-dienoyl-CoA reductase/sulfur reductase-like enzyme